MASASIISLEDRLAADVFRKPYREFLEIKSTHYRWSRLAPQSVEIIREADENHWSVEKLADYLHCPSDEADACLRRYLMSKRINAKDSTAERVRQTVFEWIGGVAELDEKARKRLADELAAMIGNQLFTAAQAREDLFKLSRELEGAEPEAPKPKKDSAPDGPPPKWGPQWKD